MESASSKVWTCVTVSISCNDFHYNTSTFKICSYKNIASCAYKYIMHLYTIIQSPVWRHTYTKIHTTYTHVHPQTGTYKIYSGTYTHNPQKNRHTIYTQYTRMYVRIKCIYTHTNKHLRTHARMSHTHTHTYIYIYIYIQTHTWYIQYCSK